MESLCCQCSEGMVVYGSYNGKNTFAQLRNIHLSVVVVLSEW